jgi:hypothetical protein
MHDPQHAASNASGAASFRQARPVRPVRAARSRPARRLTQWVGSRGSRTHRRFRAASLPALAAVLTLFAVCAVEAGRVAAQESDQEGAAPPRFRLRAEVKTHFRSSRDVKFVDPFPFPPSFLPPGGVVFLQTPQAGSSFEVSTVNLIGEANLSPNLAGRIEVHVLDLYNRNPTSSDDRIQLHEAWLRFGRKFEALTAQPDGLTAYLLAGKAPRFSKQRVRQLESYGLWGTAVGRFEEFGVELGGTVGRHLYWRGQLANGNPVFFRDPNALAGDNGTPERVPGNVHPTFQSGFPILYDTKATDVNASGRFQAGGGLGLRFVDGAGDGADLLGWYFRRKMADEVALRGTFYSGDLDLLLGPFNLFPLPIHGSEKTEWGANAEARAGGFLLFAQYVNQKIAGLPRSGAEAELAWRAEIPGILVGETPVVRWVEPVVRVSYINNGFTAPPLFPAPSVAWNWRKYDLGMRVGILPGIDVTAEYALQDVFTRPGKIHPNEFLLTLRAAY